MAGFHNSRGSALLLVIVSLSLVLLAVGGTAGLFLQREAMLRAEYTLLRAVSNAENGLEWARLRWLQALSQGESLASPTRGQWVPVDETASNDKAEVTLTRQGNGLWKVSSVGFFAESRRQLNAMLPSLHQAVPAFLAVARSLSGIGAIQLPTENEKWCLPQLEQISGIALYSPGGQIPTSLDPVPLRIQDPSLDRLQIFSGDYQEGLDGERLELGTIQTKRQILWPGGPMEEVIACSGRLRLGRDPEQSLYLTGKRLVLYAREIEINGTLDIDPESGAELWLIATQSIRWTSATLSERTFRGLLWTPGGISLYGVPQTSWCIDGAIWAGDLYLENTWLAFPDVTTAIIPSDRAPQELLLPDLQQLRIVAVGS